MARFYADENFPRPVVEALRLLGHDVLTAHEAGQADKKILDEIVLAFGHADERAVLTINRRHFIQLHKRGTDHSGIVACTEDRNFGELAVRIDEATKGDLKGQLIRITRPAR